MDLQDRKSNILSVYSDRRRNVQLVLIDSLTLLILDNSTKSIIAIKQLRSSISRYGEIGIRAGFKYQFRKEYEFDSHYRDSSNNQVTSDGQNRSRRRCMVELARYHIIGDGVFKSTSEVNDYLIHVRI